MTELEAHNTRWIRLRLGACAVLFFALLGVAMSRAVHLQILQGDQLGERARDQYLRALELTPRRGAILDARGLPLAISVETDSVFVDPRNATGIDTRALAKALSLDLALVKKRTSQKSSFAWLKRRVTPAESLAVQKLKAPGIQLVREYRRFYPQKQLAAHVLGVVGTDDEGIEGLERTNDAALRGVAQEYQALRDVRGQVLFSEPGVPSSALAGASVQLTIDASVQHAAEQALAEGVAKTKSVAGVVIVMEPKTGAILAMAIAPNFNPNAATDPANRRNRSVTDAWEPGSTIKVFSLAGALADGVASPRTVVDVTGGKLLLGRKTIRDSHPPDHDSMTLTEVIQTSSNVGTSRVALKMGPERLVNWLKAFGFGERPGSGLPGEARGVLQNPLRMGEIATATTSFGQGMSATPLQVTTALAAIANGGELMRPYIVQRITQADGEVLLERKPEAVRRVVPAAVARAMTEMMVTVTEKGGTGTQGAIPGLRVAGKTGTAQKADALTRGYGDKRYSSFMGFLPADAAEIAIYVGLDEPQGDVYGGVVAAPIFRAVALEALRQRGIRSPTAGAALTEAVLRRAQPKKDEEVVAAREGYIDDEAGAVDSLGLNAGEGRTGSGDMNGAIVPDLRGLSARAALRILGERSLEAELDGSGRATGQKPEAGRVVPPGTRVHVQLGAG